MENQKNLFERSKQLVPGGVHSPVRSFKKGLNQPLLLKRQKVPISMILKENPI